MHGQRVYRRHGLALSVWLEYHRITHTLAYATTALDAGKETLCQAEPSCLTSYIPRVLCAG